jgi:hypothetical protein
MKSCAPREMGTFPPDGWEPPGARSRKVDSLKKKWHELLSKYLYFFRMFFLPRWKETKNTNLDCIIKKFMFFLHFLDFIMHL